MFCSRKDITLCRPPDKCVYLNIIFFISQPKHILWVLKRTVSMRQFFFNHPKYMFRLQFHAQKLCLTGPMTVPIWTSLQIRLCNRRFFLIFQPKQGLWVLKTTLIETTIAMSCDKRFPTMWNVQPEKPQISLHICAV